MRRQSLSSVALLVGVACSMACQGTIGDELGFGENGPSGPASGAGGGAPGAGGGSATGGGGPGDGGVGSLALAPAPGMRRLTSDEFTRALRDLVGGAIDVSVEPD